MGLLSFGSGLDSAMRHWRHGGSGAPDAQLYQGRMKRTLAPATGLDYRRTGKGGPKLSARPARERAIVRAVLPPGYFMKAEIAHLLTPDFPAAIVEP
jgi:hypothetical protein